LRKIFRGISFYLLILIIIILVVEVIGKDVEQVKEIDVTELIELLDRGQVASVETLGNKVQGTLKDKTKFETILPDEIRYTFYSDYLKKAVDNKEIRYGGLAEPERPWILEALPTIVTILMVIIFLFIIMQQSQGGGNRVMSFGKSKAKVHNKMKVKG